MSKEFEKYTDNILDAAGEEIKRLLRENAILVTNLQTLQERVNVLEEEKKRSWQSMASAKK